MLIGSSPVRKHMQIYPVIMNPSKGVLENIMHMIWGHVKYGKYQSPFLNFFQGFRKNLVYLCSCKLKDSLEQL